MPLAGKLAPVTGGLSGIGGGVARPVTGNGVRVVVADKDVIAARRIARSIGDDLLDVSDRSARPAIIRASDLARYITGMTLPVAGGLLAYRQ